MLREPEAVKKDFAIVRKFILSERVARGQYLYKDKAKWNAKLDEASQALEDLRSLSEMNYGGDEMLRAVGRFLCDERKARLNSFSNNLIKRHDKMSEVDAAITALGRIGRYWNEQNPEMAGAFV